MVIAVSSTHLAIAQSLLLNGDFSSGNTGFESQYLYSASSIQSEGSYTVGSDPMLYHPLAFGHFGDHTTGSGLMLMFNGSMTPNLIAWQQTVTVIQNTPYNFSGYATLWGGWTPSYFSVSINGQSLGGLDLNAHAQWANFSMLWDSGAANQATIQIFADPPSASNPSVYQDIALDDLSFEQIPEPSISALFGIGLLGGLLSLVLKRSGACRPLGGATAAPLR